MWTSLVAAALLILSAAGKVFGFEISEELSTNITGLAVAILGLLVILGIISNPKEEMDIPTRIINPTNGALIGKCIYSTILIIYTD